MFEADLLKGETLLVTGGCSGLGFALCEKLVALGARVHICGRRRGVLDAAVEKLVVPSGACVVAHTVDIRDAAAVDAMCQAIFADGPLTGLVNNAAANFISPTERLSARGFDAIANTVLHGTFYLTHAAGSRWIEAGTGGSVLSIYVVSGRYTAWGGDGQVVVRGLNHPVRRHAAGCCDGDSAKPGNTVQVKFCADDFSKPSCISDSYGRTTRS